MMLPCLLLLPAWPVSMVESKQGDWKTHGMVNIFWRVLWRAGIWSFSKKCEGSWLYLFFLIFIKCAFSFSQKCFTEGCPLEDFQVPRLRVSQGCQNLKFFQSKSGDFFILESQDFHKILAFWSLSKDGLFTPLQNENKFESLWTGIAVLQIAVHDEYFP